MAFTCSHEQRVSCSICLGWGRNATSVRSSFEMRFEDDAALSAHDEKQLQWPMYNFLNVHQEFNLTISLMWTNVIRGGVDHHPPYQQVWSGGGSGNHIPRLHLSDTPSQDIELNRHIGRAVTPFACVISWEFGNRKLYYRQQNCIDTAARFRASVQECVMPQRLSSSLSGTHSGNQMVQSGHRSCSS